MALSAAERALPLAAEQVSRSPLTAALRAGVGSKRRVRAR
jgi:hypothetical protein